MPALPSPRPRTRPRLEIIPFIDIMFFLLATFMMVSLQMIQNEGLSVNLPVASASAPQDAAGRVTVTVTENGGYAWNQEALTLEQLVQRLRELKTREQDPKVLLNGDAKADFEQVVAVLDHARKLGLTKVVIQTRRGP